MCRELARYDQPVIKRFTPILTLVALCWLVFVVNHLLLSGHLNQYGIVHGTLESLPGILWAPLLHGSLKHLVANTVPLFILGAILCSRSKTEFAVITLAGILLGGGLTWLVARNACHIGASGLVFCFFGYLASQHIFGERLAPWLCRPFVSWATAECLKGYYLLRPLFPGRATWRD
jgi:membrane associated rhomboid family serine protease